MKTFYAIIGFSLLAILPLSAQQVPLVTGFGFQTQLANPAEKGTHNSPVSIWYRNQWASFGDDSPKTLNLDADLSRIFGLDKKRAGFGVRLISDQAHIVKRTSVNLDFSYHLISSNSFLLSAGVSAGLLNQRMDFADARVNEPADLALFEAAESKMRFDGGPSVFMRIGSPSGSHFKAGAFLPQLFTSDIDYEQGRIFGMQPHLQGYASYLIAGESVGLEPIVFTRMIFGDYDCKCTNIDLLLRAHLLDSRLWLGGGYRLGSGSMTGGFGLNLLDQRVQLSALVETLPEYGLSYEMGFTFALGKSSATPATKSDKPAKKGGKSKIPSDVQQKLGRYSSESDGIILETRYLLQSAEQNLSSAAANLNDAKGRTSKKKTREDIKSSREYLTRAGQDIETLLGRSNRLEQLNAEVTQIADTYQQYKTREILNVQGDYKTLSAPVSDLSNRFDILKMEIEAFTISQGLDAVDILKDDEETVQEFFQLSLDNTSGKPVDTRAVIINTQGAYVEIEYQFPYHELAYHFARDNKLSDVKAMADHISNIVDDLNRRGLTVHSVTIQGNLQSGMEDVNFESGVKYSGEFGAKPKLEYAFTDANSRKDTNRTKTLANNKEMNFEELTALQMFAIKEYIDQKRLLSKDQVKYKLYGPVSANEYFLETSILIRVKK